MIVGSPLKQETDFRTAISEGAEEEAKGLAKDFFAHELLLLDAMNDCHCQREATKPNG